MICFFFLDRSCKIKCAWRLDEQSYDKTDFAVSHNVPDEQCARKAVAPGGEGDWEVSRCVNTHVYHRSSGILIDRSGEFSHTAICWPQPGEYGITAWREDKGRNSWVRSQLSFEMLNHTCTSICFWFVPSLSLPAPLSPLLVPFSVLSAFLSVRGQAPGRGRAQARKCVTVFEYWKQVQSESAIPPRLDGREEVADSPVMSPSPENINPRNTVKILPALIKQHGSQVGRLCSQMFAKEYCKTKQHLFFSFEFFWL